MPQKPKERPELRHQMLLEESDRGCVLIGAAALDNAMEDLLRQIFSADPAILKKSVEPLLEPNGPLGSYSAKTQVLNALGLLTLDIYGDLERIRKIRNRFAHVRDPVSFDDQSVIDVVASLRTAEFFRKGIRRFNIKRQSSHAPSDRVLAEAGLVKFQRGCFAWAVEEIVRVLGHIAERNVKGRQSALQKAGTNDPGLKN